MDSIDGGVLFSDESGAQRGLDYFRRQLQIEDRWDISDADLGDDGWCARYRYYAGFAQFSCGWRRRNLVLSATMIADSESDFSRTDVEAHAAAIDARARSS